MDRTICLSLFVIVALPMLSGRARGQEERAKVPDLFGIYTIRLSGEDFQLLVADPKREMTHPRFSPDGEWVSFTRYNQFGWNGFAMEEGGYENTEIVIVRKDGTDMRTVVAPKPGVLNANSSWIDGGNGILWVSTDNPEKIPQIMRMDLGTNEITRMPIPEGFHCADPDLVGDLFVCPVVNRKNQPLFVMRADGSEWRQLTSPDVKRPFFAKLAPGDYDPRISPDASQVAFMRLFGREGWRVLVHDTRTGKEEDLSGPDSIDTLPAWSRDGKLLVFWHVDKRNRKEMGLYTMRPDGSERRMVPVPRGYLHGHPAFHPHDDSSNDPRIIYRATKAPTLP